MINDAELTTLLRTAKTVAVIGISNNPSRPSFGVSRFLQRQGFRIVPVNPAETEVHGEKAYASIKDVPDSVDIVNIFRRSDQIMPLMKDILEKRPRLIWMQEGVVNEDAAQLADASDIPVVMNRCILKELARLVPL